MGFAALIVTIVSFIICAVSAPVLIPALKRLKFGQSIREAGPESHQKKGGTPTMGGVMIIAGLLITALIMLPLFVGYTTEIWLLLLVTVGFGILGFLDDFIKIVMKRNLGLTSIQKLIGQIVIAFIFFIVLYNGTFDTSVAVPGTEWSLEFGWAYFFLIIVMLVGASNAVNLTDGLDGLLAGTGTMAFAAYALVAFSLGYMDVGLFAFAVVGSLLGFLIFNKYPAKIFMGDTGSLALGGAIAAVAILTKTELTLIVIGLVFVLETLSVIIQVISYKLRGKKVFKMSPVHHHFELSGWSEWQVVTAFWVVGAAAGLSGVALEVFL